MPIADQYDSLQTVNMTYGTFSWAAVASFSYH